MKKNLNLTTDKSGLRKAWSVAAILLVFVILSGIIVINVFFSPSQNHSSDTLICITENSPLINTDINDNVNRIANSDGHTVSSTTVHQAEPDEVDITQNPNIWTNTAQVDIFKHDDARVKSDGTGSANNVIAPGTSNDYTFSLQNSKDFSVKYTLKITGGNDTNYEIPIQLNVFDSEGNSLTGGNFVALSDFGSAADVGTVNPYTEEQYTIRWKWDFENGSDTYDTFLGNTAVDEEISCHININVISEYDQSASPDTPNSDKNSSASSKNLITTLVTTGDTGNIRRIISVFAISGILAVILLRKRSTQHFFEESEINEEGF